MILVVFVVEKLNFLDYNPLHWLILNNVLVLILNNKEDKAEKTIYSNFTLHRIYRFKLDNGAHDFLWSKNR